MSVTLGHEFKKSQANFKEKCQGYVRVNVISWEPSFGQEGIFAMSDAPAPVAPPLS